MTTPSATTTDGAFAHRAVFRFYGELNDFLPRARRGAAIEYHFPDNPGIKDPVEALGIPHTEVALIVVNGSGVDFRYQLRHGDRVAVYPAFRSLDITPLPSLREPPSAYAFVLDVHLGKLARLLRLLGFDCLYRNDFSDVELANIAAGESRILLTRDRRLLFHRRITHGHFLHSTEPVRQAREVLDQFHLRGTERPFSRCMQCNGQLLDVARDEIRERLEPATSRYYERFRRCRDCGRIYWRGAHMQGLHRQLAAILAP